MRTRVQKLRDNVHDTYLEVSQLERRGSVYVYFSENARSWAVRSVDVAPPRQYFEVPSYPIYRGEFDTQDEARAYADQCNY